MRTAIRSSQFKRDVKIAGKRDKDLAKLRAMLELLLAGTTLPARYKDHPLKGNWGGCRDAHIEPDWLLIYRIQGEALHLLRTGRHADLFDD